ncbi:MAG: hypothetical protein M1813_007956 [Trichoglossum hirsutum]|nr:MAG: hypothetical protein M1813_007956 [Trichoglossum hirsutum]
MGLEYFCKLARTCWTFSIWPLSLLFPALKGKSVTFGFWMNVVTDRVSETESSRVAKGDEQYQYRSLVGPKDIRVFELAPGWSGDPLRGRIIHSSHTGKGDSQGWSIPYEALSYCWGRYCDRDLRLVVNDRYSLRIMPDLDVALRHLRSTYKRKYLWIDVICINQDDVQEKSVQVALMVDIYARAEVVNVWLGPSKQESPMGMEVLNYFAQSTVNDRAPWDCMPRGAFFAGLEYVLNQPWFSRIWVVQEAAVSRRTVVMCGKDSFEWTNDPIRVRKLMRRIKFAAISPQWERAGLSQIDLKKFLDLLDLQMRHIERERNQNFRRPPDILDVAFDMRHRKSTDPRDKIFALMGLVDQSNRVIFRPDYSLPVEEMFQKLFDSIEI